MSIHEFRAFRNDLSFLMRPRRISGNHRHRISMCVACSICGGDRPVGRGRFTRMLRVVCTVLRACCFAAVLFDRLPLRGLCVA